MNTLLQCLDESVLLQLAEGASAPADARRHLDGCDVCRRRLKRMQRQQATLSVAGASLPREAWRGADVARTTERIDEGPLPASVGRYTVRGLIARGGQADVLLATHPTLGCDVAIKLARHAVDPAGGLRESLEHEGRALAALRHPRLPRVFDADLHAGRPYIVLELIDGKRLNDVVASRPPALVEMIERVLGVAAAVDAAHQQGLLHLDLKPENVLITPRGEARLIDFGTAGIMSQRNADGLPLATIGTLNYMAPEQHTGDPSQWTPQTDVYGLGGLL